MVIYDVNNQMVKLARPIFYPVINKLNRLEFVKGPKAQRSFAVALTKSEVLSKSRIAQYLGLSSVNITIQIIFEIYLVPIVQQCILKFSLNLNALLQSLAGPIP